MVQEMMLGAIYEFPYDFTPQGVTPCDGKDMHIQLFKALFSLLGTRYGGDGRITFKVPNLPHPVPGVGYFICIDGFYPEHQ